MRVEALPVSALQPASEWGRYEVFAPAGHVFATTGTHSVICFTAKHRDEATASKTEPCPDADCEYCAADD